MLKNNNDITRHFNENTMLVREYNNLTQLNKKLLDKVKILLFSCNKSN